MIVTTVLAVALATMGLVGFGLAAIYRPQWSLWIVFVIFSLGWGFRSPYIEPTLSARILAVLALVLLLTSVLRFLSARPRVPVSNWLLVLWLCFGVAVARGVVTEGVTRAIGEAFIWLVVLSLVTFVSGAPEIGASTSRMWVVAAVVFATAGLMLYESSGFVGLGVKLDVGNELVDPRPVTVVGAMVACQAVLLLVGSCRPWSWHRLVLVTYLLGFVVVSQHRTAWLSLAVGLLLTVVPKVVARIHIGLPVLVLGLCLMLLVVTALASTGLVASLVASGREPFASNSSIEWRIAGWRDLTAQLHGLHDWALGIPFGAGYTREVQGQVVTFTPHSTYVELALRLGVVALLAFAVLWVLVIRDRGKSGSSLGVSKATVLALVATQVLYAFTYRVDPLQAILLGALLAGAGAARHEAREDLPDDALAMVR